MYLCFTEPHQIMTLAKRNFVDDVLLYSQKSGVGLMLAYNKTPTKKSGIRLSQLSSFWVSFCRLESFIFFDLFLQMGSVFFRIFLIALANTPRLFCVILYYFVTARKSRAEPFVFIFCFVVAPCRSHPLPISLSVKEISLPSGKRNGANPYWQSRLIMMYANADHQSS
jgi:hypothetical protein